MALRPGYVHSDACPASWVRCTIGDLVKLRRGHDLTARQRSPGDIPVMGSAGPNGCHDTALAKGPGVVLGRSGASYGEAHYCTEDYWPHNTALYVTDFLGHDQKFAFYFLDAFDFSRNNSGGAQQSLNRNFIAPIKIALPPTRAEEEVIAEALSDADALIESLEQLIAKKHLIKGGAMQELLTGKRRLPGFEGEWTTRRLGEISRITMGKTPPRLHSASWGPGHFWLSIADIRSKVVTSSKEQITDIGAVGTESIPAGTLLMSFKLSIGRLCFAGCELYTNEAICAFRELQASAQFLYHALGRVEFGLYGKQAVKGYTLNKQSLHLVEVRLPPLTEQDALALVLDDMDTEIKTLETKLEKARMIKQGMMHNLLTGKIRLV